MKNEKSPRDQPAIVSRYTTLPVLIHMVEQSCLTLLPPESWSDRNDREVMVDYRQRRSLSCLLATCFSFEDETIHHWNTFAAGSAGCRIDFDLPTLICSLDNQNGIRHGKVIYKKIKKLRDSDLSDRKRPFTKRWPYRIEKEYRVIFESILDADAKRKELNVTISLDSIRSITLSQHMPESVFESVKRQLGLKFQKRISHSTLLENKVWINKFKSE